MPLAVEVAAVKPAKLTALAVELGSTNCRSIVKQASAVGPGYGQSVFVFQMWKAPIKQANGVKSGVVMSSLFLLVW